MQGVQSFKYTVPMGTFLFAREKSTHKKTNLHGNKVQNAKFSWKQCSKFKLWHVLEQNSIQLNLHIKLLSNGVITSPPPLNPEYALSLCLNPAYVLNYNLESYFVKKIQNFASATVYCMCCVPCTMLLRTEYAVKRTRILRTKMGVIASVMNTVYGNTNYVQ